MPKPKQEYHPERPRTIRVTIEGPAGIGKSRLERMLLDAMLKDRAVQQGATFSMVTGDETQWIHWSGAHVEITTTTRKVA